MAWASGRPGVWLWIGMVGWSSVRASAAHARGRQLLGSKKSRVTESVQSYGRKETHVSAVISLDQ